MKKQLSDQSFHDRRHQERKRAEAARKPVKKKATVGPESGKESGDARGQIQNSPVPSGPDSK
jgi:hypothetical protein